MQGETSCKKFPPAPSSRTLTWCVKPSASQNRLFLALARATNPHSYPFPQFIIPIVGASFSASLASLRHLRSSESLG